MTNVDLSSKCVFREDIHDKKNILGTGNGRLEWVGGVVVGGEVEKPRPESSHVSGNLLCVSTKLAPSKKKQVKKHKSGKILDSLERFWTVWKVSGKSGRFLDSLENFPLVWNVSGKSGSFLDSLEKFPLVWKVSG